MPRACTICTHPELAEIDTALLANEPFRTIAARTDTSTGALQRHKAEHLPASLIEAHEAQAIAYSDDLLAQMHSLQQRTLQILTTAESARTYGLALAAIREVRGNVELIAKLQGKLGERAATNILINPTWVNIRAVLMDVLQPFPDARATVASRLLEMEVSQ